MIAGRNALKNAAAVKALEAQGAKAAAVEADVAGLHERVLARTPAGRWGDPADFAGIAVFLASSAADFVTGAASPVDGGYSSQG